MVELESAGEMTRSEVAAFLREFAGELDDRQREEAGDDTARATGDREGVVVRLLALSVVEFARKLPEKRCDFASGHLAR